MQTGLDSTVGDTTGRVTYRKEYQQGGMQTGVNTNRDTTVVDTTGGVTHWRDTKRGCKQCWQLYYVGPKNKRMFQISVMWLILTSGEETIFRYRGSYDMYLILRMCSKN